MDKFVIDLDKVLDDFELNEDEQENSHYENLRLKLDREEPQATNDIHNPSHSNVSDLVSPSCSNVSDLVDSSVNRASQEKHDAFAFQCAGENLNTSPLANNLLSSDISDLIMPVVSAESGTTSSWNQARNPCDVVMVSCRSNIQEPSIEPNQDLWPQLRNGVNLLEGVPIENISNVGDSSRLDESSIGAQGFGSSGNNASLPSLDVIQVDDKLHNSISCESNHPDILDMRQNSHERSLIDNFNCNRPHSENVRNEDFHALPDIESFQNASGNHSNLLPDLMSGDNIRVSSCDTRESTEPAVVTENYPGGFTHTNEPAIVQESQSNNRIPEIVNVHQFTEHKYGSASNSSNFEINCQDSSANILDNENMHCVDSGEISDSEARYSNSSVNESSNNVNANAVKFDPNVDVDINEIEAELEELEEEGCTPERQQMSPRSEPQPELKKEIVESELREEGGDEQLLESHSESVSEVVEDQPNVEVSSVLQENQNSQESTSSCSLVDNLSSTKMESDSYSKESSETSSPVVSSSDSEQPENITREDLIEASQVEEMVENDGNETLNQSVSEQQDASNESPSHESEATSSEALPSTSQDPIESPNELINSPSPSEREAVCVGVVAPFWVPDEEAPNCQECGAKFTVMKRRHHCRGCGRVLCSSCCHFKAPLPYMDYKEARVCVPCLQALKDERGDDLSHRGSGRNPDPNNPMDYCSRIPPQQQVGNQANGPPPTVMVPVGVLKRETSSTGVDGGGRPRGQKQVIFSDGIRPGGDLTESGNHSTSWMIRERGRSTRRVLQNLTGKNNGGASKTRGGGFAKEGLIPRQSVPMDACLLPVGGGRLPPVLFRSSANGEFSFDANPDSEKIAEQMSSEEADPVAFALRKNVSVLVKRVKLDCCVGMDVWNIATRGLCNVSQDELVILLEVQPGEKSPPPQIFAYLNTVYQEANKGNLISEMGHSIFSEPDGFLGSRDNGGFLYIRPSYQCLQKLVLPPTPYLFAVLIQKWETPWAKVFPLRLMLRLGAEFRYYPCPLVSTRNRRSVYCEIGQTIMNLLVDFRNYAYTIPTIPGFFIHMEDKRTSLLIPKNRYQLITKALDNSNDHVLALGSNFSPHADSHLVTVEDDDGRYSTQAINIHNKPRKVTGASFIVFNGALKYNSGLKAKSSIVEDGLMIQISPDMMSRLRENLKNMRDMDIACGPSDGGHPEQMVLVRWIPDDKNFNLRIKSPIDGKEMDGIPSVKIHSGTDYVTNDHLIRWTEIFIIQGEAVNSNTDINISRLAESLARAFCMALTPHLGLLYDTWPSRVALRASLHQDSVGYEAGKDGSSLSPVCMKELDGELIPVIHRVAENISDRAIILELIFHIME